MSQRVANFESTSCELQAEQFASCKCESWEHVRCKPDNLQVTSCQLACELRVMSDCLPIGYTIFQAANETK